MKHPLNEHISFDEKNHTYFIDNRKVNCSVTEFVHNFFPKFESEKIVNKWYDIWQQNENSKYFGYLKEEILQEWEDIRIESSNKGTLLHNSIDEYYKNKKIPNFSIIPEFKYYLDFENNYDEFTPISSEWAIFDEELDIAGTIDRISQCSEGKYHMFDWKRSKEIKETSQEDAFIPINYLPNSNYWKYALQLNMYSYILEKNYDIIIDSMHLVLLHPKYDEYKIFPVKKMKKEIEEMIKSWQKNQN